MRMLLVVTLLAGCAQPALPPIRYEVTANEALRKQLQESAQKQRDEMQKLQVLHEDAERQWRKLQAQKSDREKRFKAIEPLDMALIRDCLSRNARRLAVISTEPAQDVARAVFYSCDSYVAELERDYDEMNGGGGNGQFRDAFRSSVLPRIAAGITEARARTSPQRSIYTPGIDGGMKNAE